MNPAFPKSFVVAGDGRGRTPRSQAAFTMIEIALSLAVIGFALVAIIGVLPLGMNVQRENREETIINQDATLLMEAIRSGAQGMDDLTNYVLAITNQWVEYDANRTVVRSDLLYFTPTNSAYGDVFPLTNGFRIVGLLSAPKYIPFADGGFRSNFVVANVRSFSGAAHEKYPQDNQISRDLGLSYRLVPEITTYGSPVSIGLTNNAWDRAWVDFSNYPTNSPEYVARRQYAQYASHLNLFHDLRLIFRWPLLPGGRVGQTGRQVYRASASGVLNVVFEPGFPQFPLYFLEPRTYTTNSL